MAYIAWFLAVTVLGLIALGCVPWSASLGRAPCRHACLLSATNKRISAVKVLQRLPPGK